MSPEKRAVIVSELLAQLVCLAVFCLIGYGWIPDVDNTLFPPLGIALTVYLFIGNQVLYSRGIWPPASAKIKAGKVDVAWGLSLLYWQCWWPSYRRKK